MFRSYLERSFPTLISPENNDFEVSVLSSGLVESDDFLSSVLGSSLGFAQSSLGIVLVISE